MSIDGRLAVPRERLAALCRERHIRKLALFGSVLTPNFRPESDVDVLVEFEPGHVPGFGFVAIEEELSALLGRRVDLHTAGTLSPYFRDQVVGAAEAVFTA
jgi:predicted nucleotidyltransferase